MKKSHIAAISLLALTGAFTSCNPNGASETYKSDQIGETREVQVGTITAIHNVTIEANDADMGTGIGAVAGGLTGAMFGGGNAKYATAAGGAILGAIAGNQIDKATSTQKGVRIGVRLDSGKYVEVTQLYDKKNPLWKGQRVEVLMGSKGSRVIPR